MNFLITGGCGYIGSQLTQCLLSKKNKVTIVDNCWFGNSLKKNKMLKIIKKDIRNFEVLNIRGIDTIIHLANVSTRIYLLSLVGISLTDPSHSRIRLSNLITV